ncbi:ABC transporter ATP-binding protein [Rheinheimera sp. SA_1]|uniref:ABC transporter ATP-binding protein n=1 Tax=Rheinheimera sp. SA_1 TaxID=1827365 RepID=UPI0018D4D411|nr:ABC transporter ATP-binding protein [Rheinheimera sp. SA_1]
MSNQPLISCTNLNFLWHPHAGLQQVDLTLYVSDRLGIIGPNGAGKSTLLKLLAGLLRPASGEILLCGKPLPHFALSEKARILALLAQDTEQATASTVFELVELGLLPHKQLWQRTDQDDKLRISQVLTQVGLADKATASVSSLSGGELQRAQFARVLLQGARLLLLDEPTNHLDVQYQHQLLQNIVSTDLSLIASFHDLNLAASYCNQLLLLQHGKVVAAGSPEQVLQPKLISEVFGRRCLVDLNPFDGKPRVTFAPGACND